MSAFRRVAVSAVLPVVLLLNACGGGEDPASSQAIDLSRHLASIPGTWQDQPVRRTQVTAGADAVPVTVEWTPAHNRSHRGISRINVAFPAHRKGDTYQAAVVGTPVNHGTKEAVLEGVTLQVRWTRNAATRAQLQTAIVHLKGDGTSSTL